MIKHVVLWQLKDFASEEAKSVKLTEIKEALESLFPKVSVLKALDVGINVNSAEQYDIMLSTTFNSLEDLAVYAKHPDHVIVGGMLKPVVKSRACVDYEI